MSHKKIIQLLVILFLVGHISACSTTPSEEGVVSDNPEQLAETEPVNDADFSGAFDSEGLEDNLEEVGDADVFAGEEPLEAPKATDDIEAPIKQELATEVQADLGSEKPVPPSVFVNESGVGQSSGQLIAVQDIAFRSNQAGGTVVIQTSEPAIYSTRMNPQTNQFILELKNAQLPKKLKRPYITTEFTSEFKSINAYQNDGGSVARVVIQMGSSVSPMIQSEGRTLLVIPVKDDFTSEIPALADSEKSATQLPDEGDFDPESPEAWSYDLKRAKKDEKLLRATNLAEFMEGPSTFYGRRISIETSKDADIRDIIQFISEESGVNMVIAEEVAGSLQLKLREVPWDQALMIVLRSKKLGYVRQGNVIRITTLAALESETKQRKDIIESSKDLVPLVVKIIPISFAKVSDLNTQLKPFLTPNRGALTVDTRTSSIVIKDTPDIIEKLEKLVAELDVPPSQVMIEGKIVEANEQFSKNFGINWGFTGAATEIGATNNSGLPVQATPSLGISTLSNTSGAGTFNLNVGQLNLLGNLSARLAINEANEEAKVISSPRVLALNNETANIKQTGEVLTPAVVVNGDATTTTFERVPYSMNLSVTPQITASGSVIMDVSIQRQFPGSAPPGTSPPIRSREAKTKAIVNNGETAVIGGIFQNDLTKIETGVPYLKDIPFLGWLFKSNTMNRVKTELLIFLTPRIVNLRKNDLVEEVESRDVFTEDMVKTMNPNDGSSGDSDLQNSSKEL